MTEFCKYVDVCISNEEDAKDVFGIEAEGIDSFIMLLQPEIVVIGGFISREADGLVKPL